MCFHWHLGLPCDVGTASRDSDILDRLRAARGWFSSMSVESALPEHHQSTSSDAESFEVVNLRPGDVLGEVLEGLDGLEAYCASIRLIEGSCWYYVDPDNPCVACGGMDCEQG